MRKLSEAYFTSKILGVEELQSQKPKTFLRS